jgi:serine protease
MVQFMATAEQTYKIAVDSYSWMEGEVYLGINCPALPPSSRIPLALGVATNNLFGTYDSQTLYKVSIPSGLASLQISISGGEGDCDLYVRHGWPPTLNDYDYAPYLDGNDETVSIPNPAAGDCYIMLHGFGSYSGVTLLAQ